MFGTMEFGLTFQKLGMESSSQLTKSIIFQRGRLKPPTSWWSLVMFGWQLKICVI